jgi:probable HAF family extracellular repeat protein
MVDLGTLGSGFRASVATDVNNKGMIVGYSDTKRGPVVQRAFAWTAATGMIALGTLGGASSAALGVNDEGQVIGFSDGPLGQEAFVWTAAEGMIGLGTLGGGFSFPAAINNHGQIVGEAGAPDGVRRAFLWTATSGMVDLGTLGEEDAAATAINNAGMVVGTSGLFRAFSWTPLAGMVDLGTFGGNIYPNALNNRGDVVGYGTSSVGIHAFLWTVATGLTNLGSLGGGASVATAINQSGMIAGYSSTSGFDTGRHAFSWTAARGMTDLGTLGGPQSEAVAVNEAGQIVGWSDTAVGRAAVLWNASRTRPQMHVTTPNDPSRWGINTRQRLAWTYDGDAPQLHIEISRDGGALRDSLPVVPRSGGSQNFYWTVTAPNTTNARLRVTAIGDDTADSNDANIRIAPATIEFVLPYSTSVVRFGTPFRLFWKHNLGARVPVAVDVSQDGGSSWRPVTARAETKGSDTSSFRWTVDLLPTNRARLRIRALDGSGASGMSAVFTVRAPR